MDIDAERILIERAQNGDPSAYEELFRAYRPRVFRIVNQILRDSGDADDVVQDIFLTLFGALKTFRHQSSFFTWLYRIALNAVRSWQSARTRESHAVADDENDEIEKLYSSETDQPEARRARAELADLLDVAIIRLPSQLREAFLLREIDELSYIEIAEVTNVPLGTVRSRIARARAQLATSLAEQYGDTLFDSTIGIARPTHRDASRLTNYFLPVTLAFFAQFLSF